MIRFKIRDVAYECDETTGTAKVFTPGSVETFTNAIEAYNVFKSYALQPLERDIRNRLEENGFNRWTGLRNNYTESELKAQDSMNYAFENFL